MEELLLVFEPGVGEGHAQILWTPCTQRQDGRGVFSTGVAIAGTADEARSHPDVKRVYLYDDDGTFGDPVVFDREAGVDRLDEALAYLENKYAKMLAKSQVYVPQSSGSASVWGD